MASIRQDNCICNWEDCSFLQSVFKDDVKRGRDEVRGGPVMVLNLEGDSRDRTVWRKAVVSSLGADLTGRRLDRVPVARHHWSVEQLRFFFSENVCPSKPLEEEDVKRLTHSFSRKYRVEQEGASLYFNIPNCSHDYVLADTANVSTIDGQSQTSRHPFMEAVDLSNTPFAAKSQPDLSADTQESETDRLEEESLLLCKEEILDASADERSVASANSKSSQRSRKRKGVNRRVPQQELLLSPRTCSSEEGERPLNLANTPVIKNTKKRRKMTKGKKDPGGSGVDMVEASQYLAYSWDSLGLGSVAGTPALNEFFRRQLDDPRCAAKSVPQLTAQQSLQAIQSLRLRTALPPEDSDLHNILQRSRAENRLDFVGDDEDVDDDNLPQLPIKLLGRLYEDMCSQDIDDGTDYRRQMQYVSAPACIEQLQSMENEISALKLREQRVLQTGRDLGLYSHKASQNVCRLLGFQRPMHDEVSDGFL